MEGFRYNYKTKRRILFSLYLLAVLANQGEFFIPKMKGIEKKSEGKHSEHFETEEREFPEHLPDQETQDMVPKNLSLQPQSRHDTDT